MPNSQSHSSRTFPSLDQLKRVHIIGVCGTLMGAFAAFLRRRGITVTGSDQNVYPPMSDVLAQAGVVLCNGYDPKNLKHEGKSPDLVVIGNVIGATNPEARAAIDGGMLYTSLPEAMEKIILPKTRNLVVAGTHGKTTTASLLATTLVRCGKNPGYFIGGVMQDLPHSFHVTSTDAETPFVLEGDEYDTAFWDKVPKFNHYLPVDTILTSVEFDHADIYADMNAVTRAFEGLMDRIQSRGRLIACFDYETVKQLAKRAKVPVISYGLKPGARFTAREIHIEDGRTRFKIYEGDRQVEEMGLQIPGAHNVLNALAVWIECRELGLPSRQIVDAMEAFQGVKRRQEVRGEVSGVMVIDDFAHHPTAVRETLGALRQRYAGRRLVAVFEPRSATSRRKVFQKDYATAFSEADAVYIAAPYDQSKIAATDQFSSEELVADLVARGLKASTFSEVDEGVTRVARSSAKGDVIAVLSNGGFGGFIPKLLKNL